MHCRFVEPTGKMRHTKLLGIAAEGMPQYEFVDKVNRKYLWCAPWAPGLEFGPGTLVFAHKAGIYSTNEPNDHLWLLVTDHQYIDITNYEREGEPPMISIKNPPANWTLENGEFKYGNRDYFIQISSRSEA